MKAAPQTPVLAGHDGFGLVSFLAGLALAEGQGIMCMPLAQEPVHAEVFGKKTRAVKKALAKNCQWVVSPPR